MKHDVKRTKLALALLFGGALILTGCRASNKTNLITKTKMHQVKTAKKLRSLLEEGVENEESFFWGPVTDAIPVPEEDVGTEGTTSREHSETNVQVTGVDEGDVIKTDGDQVFYAPRFSDKFYVFDVDANYEISVTKEIKTPGFNTESLYLTEDYLITLSYGTFIYSGASGTVDPAVSTETGEAEIVVPYSPAFSGTKITLYERANFSVSYEVEFNFYIANHRLINDSLFFVGDLYVHTEEAVPQYRENASEVMSTSYNDIYYFEDSYASSLTVVGGLLLNKDATKIKHTEKAYLTSHIYLRDIYVSYENLYILSSNYYYEKEQSYQTTTISQHKLNLNAATTEFVAASNVKGVTLNQFSADEHNGYFRIATTNSHATWRVTLGSYIWESYEEEVTNYLFILKADARAQDFSLVGYLDEGLGKPGESIKSVRFDGEKALIVTFLRTDPLYVINLNDPTKPVITDAIELPGYDVYQHNWGTNRALGFGYNATNTGIVNGMKLTAYDVTEGSASELETYRIYEEGNDGSNSWAYGYSEALYNHRAMLVHVGKGLFGFPMQMHKTSQTNNNEYIYEYSSAYYLFKINFEDEPIISNPIVINHASASDAYGYVDRAVMIDDYVYTFSSEGVVVLSLISEEVTIALRLNVQLTN